MHYAIGIDSGSTTTKGVIYNGSVICHQRIVPTSYNPRHAMQDMLKQLRDYIDSEHASPSVAVFTTGYGRELIEDKTQSITEITCHGAGSKYLYPEAELILDIGGQDSKVIRLGAKGTVSDFLMNDKCAAGTGRFIEVMMRTLHKDLLDMDEMVSDHQPAKISSMCAVFAESEVISLLAKGAHPEEIALGVVDSICERSSNFAKRLGNPKDVFLSGGLAQSETIRKCLEKHLECPVIVHENSQYAGAIGAAILGYQKHFK